MRVTNVFTDGSAIGNPGPGGWAVIVYDNDQVREYAGAEAHTTNNRMELTAVIKALQRTADTADALVVHADSQYVLRGAREWLSRWQANGWKTTAKQPVLNQDLWETIAALLKNRSVEWKHVRGHAGHPENERADKLANGLARGEHVDLYSGTRAKYPLSSGSKKVNYVSVVDGLIETHSTWKECEARVKGIVDARFKKVSSEHMARETARAWRAQESHG